MVVVNDNPDAEYVYDHPNIKIINCKDRFPSISAKIEWGYKQCKYDYVYRLDDDDLLVSNALEIVSKGINSHPGYEIYRSNSHYFFVDNIYKMISDNVNNGNVYTKSYLDRIKFPNRSGDEDNYITFSNSARIYTLNKPTMIYRWGMSTLHISGLGKQSNEKVLKEADKVLNKEKGSIKLVPKFNQDYYKQIKKPL